jgi:hypothetical protein
MKVFLSPSTPPVALLSAPASTRRDFISGSVAFLLVWCGGWGSAESTHPPVVPPEGDVWVSPPGVTPPSSGAPAIDETPSLDTARLDNIISQVQGYAIQNRNIYLQCSGAGTTYDPANPNPSAGCTPGQQAQIELNRNSLFATLGSYFDYPLGLAEWSGAAIFDSIMGLGHDIAELADGTTLASFRGRLANAKIWISQYVKGGNIDFAGIKNDLLAQWSDIEEELRKMLDELPSAISSLDTYNQWYYTGYIVGNGILDLVNPEKKLKMITHGAVFGIWWSIARYLIDARNSGHTLVQKIDIADRLRRVSWSKVDKPDMSRVTNLTLLWDYGIEWWYREAGIIGNRSTADAIRYTKVTWMLVGGSDHVQKWTSILWNIENLLKWSTLNQYEKGVLDAIKNDLLNAMN